MFIKVTKLAIRIGSIEQNEIALPLQFGTLRYKYKEWNLVTGVTESTILYNRQR